MHLMWNDIKLIISDFDGVMTDNRVYIDETGKETVCVNRADGQAIHMLRSMEIDLVIVSTEINDVVRKRAEKLKIECVQNVTNKAEYLKKYCNKRGISLQNTAYIGNDINDFEAMRLARIKIAPCDAYEEVKSIADYVTVTKGGYGVVREVAGVIKRAMDNQE